MKLMCGRQALTVLCCVVLSTMVACSSKPRGPVPVEDRVAGQGAARQAKSSVASSPANAAGGAVSTPISMGAAMPGSENAGKPGYYSVRSGDTLTKIALDHGQAWRDIAKWNGLDNPNVIEVDQVLRVVPPVVPPVSAEAKAPATQRQASTPQVAQAQTAQQAAPQPTPQTAPQVASPSNTTDDGLAFAWPHQGAVLAGFDEAKNKGLDFAGKAGDPVMAAADGKVVYAGSGLRGYGNLVILKHNNTYLTAYAHNQTLLVKEDQTVQKGQRIAEMGSTDADRVKLHFEIRKQGKPVDPTKYLPSRP
jgi:lipoprotein NlpD